MLKQDYSFIIRDLAELQNLANIVSSCLNLGDVVTFSGNLGVGKTTFVRYIINSIAGTQVDVTSPTFNLVSVYQFENKQIWHFDLYRLTNAEEVFELGIEEAWDGGISLIEWPEIANHFLPDDRLEVKIVDDINELQARVVFLKAYGNWQKKLGKILESRKL